MNRTHRAKTIVGALLVIVAANALDTLPGGRRSAATEAAATDTRHALLAWMTFGATDTHMAAAPVRPIALRATGGGRES